VPRLIGSFIDNELTQTLKTRQPAPNLYISIIHLVVIYAAVFLCNVVQGIISARTSAALVQRLRYDIFKKLTRLPVSYFDTTPHGDLMSRLTNDVDNINNGFSSIVTSLFTGITTLVMAVIFMVSASLVLSATVLITLPLGIIISAFITRRTRRYFAAQQEKLGLLNAYIEEHLLGQREIKAFGREETVKAEFGELNNSLRQIGVQAQFYSNSIPPIINAVNNFSFVLMITVGVWLAFNNMLGITIGLIAAFGQYARQLSRPINDLANQVNMLQSILAGAERVMELLHEKEEQDEGSDRLDAADAGSLTFKHISFSYVPDNPVLKDISFHVREGETMAIVGPTGSGKTTLINLLMRFYTAQSGSIMFNNKDIKLFSRQSLRSRIGIVFTG
jgi:ATP-binding cassette subfamily B multidrug efflux pump